MEEKQQELTPREQAYFEHVRQAKEQGLTLKAYCEQVGLNERNLYSVRRVLVDKGILPRTLPPKAPKTKKPGSGQFVAVRVAGGETNGAQVVCRVRHPSGWAIECSRFPEAAWVLQLMEGADHASA